MFLKGFVIKNQFSDHRICSMHYTFIIVLPKMTNQLKLYRMAMILANKVECDTSQRLHGLKRVA